MILRYIADLVLVGTIAILAGTYLSPVPALLVAILAAVVVYRIGFAGSRRLRSLG